MVVITALAWIASTDVVRHRPMLLALAAGKAASSITSFVFFFQDDVFAYLLNGIVDGSLVGATLLLWSLAGRSGGARGAPLKAPAGAASRRASDSASDRGGARPWRRRPTRRRARRFRSRSRWRGFSRGSPPERCRWCGSR